VSVASISSPKLCKSASVGAFNRLTGIYPGQYLGGLPPAFCQRLANCPVDQSEGGPCDLMRDIVSNHRGGIYLCARAPPTTRWQEATPIEDEDSRLSAE
jgi:hypothetical protein